MCRVKAKLETRNQKLGTDEARSKDQKIRKLGEESSYIKKRRRISVVFLLVHVVIARGVKIDDAVRPEFENDPVSVSNRK